MKPEKEGINPLAEPSGIGCLECLAEGGWWFHLRRCAECGHIGCCDSSPNQHTHPNITQPQVTRSSRVSNLENGGSTIIALESFLLDLSFPILSHILQINPCPGQLVAYPQIGKRFFMSDRLGLRSEINRNGSSSR